MTAAQAQTSAPAPVPAAPRAPATVTISNPDGTTQTLAVPLTRQDVADIRARREELSSQLTSAAGRRRRLAEDIKSATDGPARSGLEQRLIVLDNRIVQLEADIASTGRQLSAAPQGLIQTQRVPVNDIPENVLAISMVFTIFVLFPIAFAFARHVWKRAGKGPPSVVQLPSDAQQRLERLEQGVEAIAIEIERVSEGQRFVTKLLAEAQPAAKLGKGAGAAEEMRMPAGS